MASCGFHAAKITSATAIQPRPPTLSLSHTPPLMIMLQYAPPMPQMPPPSSRLMYLNLFTGMLAASAAPGFSPMACTFRPVLVPYRYQPAARATATPRYTNTL